MMASVQDRVNKLLSAADYHRTKTRIILFLCPQGYSCAAGLFRLDEQFKRISTRDKYNIILKIEVLGHFGLHLCDQPLAVRSSIKQKVIKLCLKLKVLPHIEYRVQQFIS